MSEQTITQMPAHDRRLIEMALKVAASKCHEERLTSPIPEINSVAAADFERCAAWLEEREIWTSEPRGAIIV